MGSVRTSCTTRSEQPPGSRRSTVCVRAESAVFYGNASGPVPPFDLQELNKRGSLFVTRPTLLDYTATEEELAWRAGSLHRLVTSGDLKVDIHATYPLAEAAQAQRDLESGATAGKLLLKV